MTDTIAIPRLAAPLSSPLPLSLNTPGGIPYPEPTDPVAQGADAMQEIAAQLDPSIVKGNRAAAQNLTNAAWTPITTWTQIKRVGDGLTLTTAGVICNRAGEVTVEAWGIIGSNNGGTRRGAGVWLTGGMSAAAPQNMGGVLTGQAAPVYITATLTVTAGQIVSFYIYQDSGSTITSTAHYLTAYMRGGL